MNAPEIRLPPEYEATASRISAVLVAFSGDSAAMRRLARHLTQDVACIRSESSAPFRPEVSEADVREIQRLGAAAEELLAAANNLSFEAWNRIGHAMTLRGPEGEEPHFLGLTRLMQAEKSRERRLIKWIAEKAGAAWKTKPGGKPVADRHWAYVVHGVASAYHSKTGKAPSVYADAATGAAASPYARLLKGVLAAAELPMLSYGELSRYLNNYWPIKARDWFNRK